ncbi:MAG: SlyX family protein [Kofleriaceae bacterium]
MDTDDRITELEIKLVYQEQLIKELDALVRSFGDKLDAQTRELEKMKAGIRSPEVPMGPQSEKPPHY